MRSARKRAKTAALRRAAFIPDTHRPYHDQRAWRVLLAALRAFGPQTVVVLGDFFDCWAVSSHSKDPRRKLDLASEIADGDAGLRDLEALGADELIFCEGNHEWRLDRYVSDRAQEVYRTLAPAGLLTVRSLPEALGLKQRGWQWHPYKSFAKLGKLHLTHDCGRAGARAHEDAQAAFESNAVIGHTHRLALTVRGSARGEAHVGAMFGWLGDVTQVDYMHKIRALRDWALGFGIGWHDPSSGAVYVQPVPIVNYSVVINGQLVRA